MNHSATSPNPTNWHPDMMTKGIISFYKYLTDFELDIFYIDLSIEDSIHHCVNRFFSKLDIERFFKMPLLNLLENTILREIYMDQNGLMDLVKHRKTDIRENKRKKERKKKEAYHCSDLFFFCSVRNFFLLS